MRKVGKRLSALLLVVMLLLSTMVVPASATDVPVTDTSFYVLASNASTFLSDALATDDTFLENPSLTSSNVGGFLGYSDAADESGIVSGWIASALSYSSATYSYASLYNLRTASEDDTIETSTTLSFWEYAQYGRLLTSLGLDATGSDSSQVGHFLRLVSGWLMKISYYAVWSVNFAFKGVLGFMDMLNPFKLFKPPEPSLAGLAEYADGSPLSGVQQIGQLFGSFYQFVWDWAPFIIGAWLVVFAVTSLLSNQGHIGEKFKRFILRAFVLILGIPLLAVTYTELLGMMHDDSLFNSAGDAAAETVFGIYVDFENWAARGKLATSGISGDTLVGEVVSQIGTSRTVSPSLETYVNLQDTVRAINRTYAGTSGGTYYAATVHTVVESMLDRYIDAAQFTASDYESYARRNWSYDTTKDILEKTGTTVIAFKENWADMFTNYNMVWNSPRNGQLVASPQSYYSVNATLDYGSGSGLTVMSMYNYLSTKFEPTNMIVYSNEKASSGFVRESHYSVNQIGNGFSAFLYWFAAWTQLIVTALMGWLWCFGMFFNTIKRMIRMCMALPGAMLGSIKAFAHIIVYTIMGIMEILITIMLFQVGAAMISGLGQMMNGWAAGIVNAIESGVWGGMTFTPANVLLSGEAVAASSSTVVVLIPQILTVFGYLGIGYLIIRMRGSAMKAVDEMLTDVTNRLFSVNNTASVGGGNLGAALGAGVGAGVAQKLASGGDKNESKNLEGGVGGQGSIGESQKDDSQTELESGDSTSLEAGDGAGDGSGGDGGDSDVVNLSDNDVASASFSEDGDDESAEMDAANSMNSLDGGDGGESGQMESGADAADQVNDMADEIKGEVEDGDVEGAVAIAGGDTADDVQKQADMQAADLREKAPGHEAGKKQDADKQNADGKQGQDGKSGQAGQKQGEQSGKQGAKSGEQSGKQTGDQAGKQSGQTGDKKDQQSKSDVKQGDAAKSGSGQKTGEHKDGKQSGQQGTQATGSNAAKAGAAGVAAGSAAGADGKTGSGAGSSKGEQGASGSGKPVDDRDTHVDDRDNNINAVLATDGKSGDQGGVGAAQGAGAQGQSGQGATPEGGSSSTLSEAYSRNAEAKAKLAELQAQQGQMQQGAAGAPVGTGSISTDKDGNIGSKQVADSRSGVHSTSGQPGSVGANGQPVKGGAASQGQTGQAGGQQQQTAAPGSLGTEQRGGNVGAKQDGTVGSQSGAVGGAGGQQSGGQLHTDRQSGNVGAAQQSQSGVGGQSGQGSTQSGAGSQQSGGQLHTDRQSGNVGATQSQQGGVSGQSGQGSVQSGVGGQQSGGQLHTDRQSGNVGATQQPQSGVGGQAGQGSVQSGAGTQQPFGVGGATIAPDGTRQGDIGARQGEPGVSGGQIYTDRQGGNVGVQQGQQVGSDVQGQAVAGAAGVAAGAAAVFGGRTLAGERPVDGGSQGQQAGVGARQSGAPEKMGPSAPMGAMQFGRDESQSGGLAQGQSGGIGSRQQSGGAEVSQSRERAFGVQTATGKSTPDTVGAMVGEMQVAEREQSTLRTSGDAIQMDTDRQRVTMSRDNGVAVSRDSGSVTTQQSVGAEVSREQSSVRIIPGGDGQSVQISRDPQVGQGGYGANPGQGQGRVVSERSSQDVSTRTTTTTSRQVSGGGRQPMSNRAVAGIAAQAAVAAFMANSNNSFVQGMGQVQMMGVAQQIHGGRPMVGGMELGEKGNGFVETTTTVTEERQTNMHQRTEQDVQDYQESVRQQIDSLDADTAAIEAQIRALEQQRNTRPVAPSRQLGIKPDGADEYL